MCPERFIGAHRFVARYDKKETARDANLSGYFTACHPELVHQLSVLEDLTYVYDICVFCGKTVRK